MKTRMILVLAVVSGVALAAWPSASVNPFGTPAQARFDPCDWDNDGYVAASCGGDDCNDLNSQIHPGATEICDNRRDDDCDGDTDFQALRDECDSLGWVWFAATCSCSPSTPVVVDTLGDGFRLTDAAGGVDFDINGDGLTEHLSWTAAGTDDAWLALDRNGNGLIDDGTELFGNFTPQPPVANRHGFLALAEFDRPARGGDGDGKMTGADAVYGSLLLWRDANHNGTSEPGELRTLPALGLKSIDCDYKESKRTDEFGNKFRYRAKVADARDTRLGRWAWDVFLVSGR